ncbi:LPS export ABC transporter permease LptF [Rhodobacter sp. Har01]|uniref:LPS export ABC transporter permease LptF n=1 Tax=Rhodobacter sp. Har01 TaxID=2883999 RepID=UPI001D06741D|nr:LPS export ABC transporter permease LptF [Rhodobacter sp. Har01]MCB6177287.1 LPS export ABC transporter permease LptF [Rhodobacter sp. Har01]
MARFDRYLLSYLLQLFGFFSLLLVAVYWVNRAVGLFDQLIGDGQSALVFLEFSLLSLPNVIRLVLPVSAFAACLYAINRLSQESELVVMQATGFSAVRLSRPVVLFGVCVMAMHLVLANVLVPMAQGRLQSRSAEISADVTARFLNEGRFLHPADGLTIYIREITPLGELNDLFLSDERGENDRVVYTARRALIVRGETAPQLVMLDGAAQRLTRDVPPRISITRFNDFTLDLGAIVQDDDVRRKQVDELSTLDLLEADPVRIEAMRTTRAVFLEQAHSRLAGPLLGLAAPLLGFAALMLGGFSRFGLWRQVGLAVLLLIGLQMVATSASGVALRNDMGWLLLYLAPALGLAVSAVLLWLAQRPRQLGYDPAAVDGAAA